jgi:glyoxylase-like metal-dependent hydrolase (beta-lactamase superfamily II)
MAIDLTSTLHHSATGVEIHKLVVGPIANNVFVVRCTETGDAALIDAANEHDKLLELARATGVSTILETHGHWDHIAAIPAMREAGYKIGITAEDAPMLSKVSYDYLLEDETVIEVGKLRLRTILNPGHTPGSMSFKLEDPPVLFSGDTLFPGGPGATNTQDGSFDTIIESIDRLLFAPLDADTIVMPGHGDDTTIGAERPNLDEWVSRGW